MFLYLLFIYIKIIFINAYTVVLQIAPHCILIIDFITKNCLGITCTFLQLILKLTNDVFFSAMCSFLFIVKYELPEVIRVLTGAGECDM